MFSKWKMMEWYENAIGNDENVNRINPMLAEGRRKRDNILHQYFMR
jgi:hypothetical protein